MKSGKWAIAAVSLLLPLTSYAVPVKFPECAKHVRYNEVPGGAGAVFNEDCTVLYVLPPLTGHLTISGYKTAPELGARCQRWSMIDKETTDLEKISVNETRRLKILSDKRLEMVENLEAGLVPIGETPESMQAKIDKMMDEMDKIRDRIVKYQKQNNEKKLEFAKETAGRGQFLIVSPMADTVKAYQNANPRLRVTAMPVDQAFLSVNEIKPEDSSQAAMPWVLSLRAIGIGSLPMLRDPALLLQFKELNPGAAPDGSKIFGGALPGELVMGNMGACAVSKSIGSQTSFSAGDLKSDVVAAVTYSYQVQVKRRHKLSYDFKELIRVLHEQTKRGGFFSSETLNRMIDDRSTDSWIEFDVSSDDTRFEYTDAYVREVKKEFIDRALAQIIAVKTGSPAAMLALIEPGKNGAATIGEELGKCPHLYCQIGAAGMNVLNSIFGSSTQTAELIKAVSGRQVEIVTEKKMVQVPGTTVFQ